MVWKLSTIGLLALLCVACGKKIETHADAGEANLEIYEDMIEILEGVTDEASAKDAIPEMEEIGRRIAEVQKAIKDLPQMTKEDIDAMSEMAKKTQVKQREVQQQFAKLGQYPELMQAVQNAMMGKT